MKQCKGGVRNDVVASTSFYRIGAVQGRSETSLPRRERGAACSGWDSRSWCVLGSLNEGPSRDWAWWRLDGWKAGRPRRKEGELDEGPSFAISAMFFFRICLCILAFFLDEKGCWQTFILCTHIHEFLYFSHLIYLFTLLSYLIFDFVCYHWPKHMELSTTHAHTYRDTQTHAHTKTNNDKKKGGGKQKM